MARICPACGKVLEENARFCVKCGRPVKRAANELVRYPSEIVESDSIPRRDTLPPDYDVPIRTVKKKKKTFPFWIPLLLLILAGGAAAAYFILFSNTVNINKYIEIKFEGTDGEGTAWAEFDTDAFISDYGTKIQYKTDVDWINQAASLLSTPAALLKDSCIKGNLDRTSGLSNGDEVVFTWDCDDVSASRYFGVKFRYSDIKVKVKGLSENNSEEPLPEEDNSLSEADSSPVEDGILDKESSSPVENAFAQETGNSPIEGEGLAMDDTEADGDTHSSQMTENPADGNRAGTTKTGNTNPELRVLDPFANIEIQYDGVSPYLSVSVNDGRSEEVVRKHVTFSVKDGEEHTACGQNLTLTAEFHPDELEAEGYQIKSTEKQYTVPDNLPKYLAGEEAADLTRVRNDLYDYLEAHASSAVGQEAFWVQNGMDFVNHAQVGKDGLYNPEITKIDSITEIRRYWMNRKTQYDTEDSIHNRYAVLYKIEISARGYRTNNDSVDYKKTAYSLVSAENIYTTEDGISWTGPNGLGGEKIICHSQMDEKDQLLSNWMTSYKDEYNVTESEPQKKEN